MARTAEQYRKLFLSLMPKGKLWSSRIASVLQKLLLGSSDELVRVDTRANDLFDEQDVRTTVELLEEHETDYGLPEVGESISTITSERQAELAAAVLRVGQQFPQYYIDIAAALGYTITIEQFQPFWVGFSTVNTPVGDQYNLFWWIVWIDLDSVTRSAEVNLTKLISRIEATKPGHTHVGYRFKGAEYSRAYSSAYNSIPSYDNSWLNGEYNREYDNSYANAYDYDGVNFTGAYDQSFSIAYDRHSGGAYGRGYSVAYSRPH